MIALTALCACGCGGLTSLAKQTSRKRGHIKGEPIPFIRGHFIHPTGSASPAWKGGRSRNGDGYVSTWTGPQEREYEHVLLAERALGKPLPPGSPVHHVDENRSNNGRGNLVICQDNAYHKLLHRRARAFDSCGDANAIRCGYCSSYDRQSEMSIYTRKNGVRFGYHRNCAKTYRTRAAVVPQETE